MIEIWTDHRIEIRVPEVFCSARLSIWFRRSVLFGVYVLIVESLIR